jgi:hypothetical protein
MQVINRKGEVFNVDGDVVPDGCSLRTNVFMLDSGLDDTQREIGRRFSRPRARVCDAIGRTAGHRPGFLLMDTSSGVQDAAEGAREIRKRQLSDSWRQPMNDGPALARAHAAALHGMAADLEQTAEEETGEDAKRASAFTTKWTGAFEADDAEPNHPQPDSDAEYQASKVAASNRWKTSTARSAENYPDDDVRQAVKLAKVLNISAPYTRTMTTPDLAGQAVERELRQKHDAITDAAIASRETELSNAWRTP